MLGKTSLVAGLAFATLVSAQSPTLLRDINTAPPPEPSSWPTDFAPFGGHVYFAAETPATGRELCRSDGTQAGTGVVADLIPGVTGSEPGLGVAAGPLLFFPANHPQLGRELFATDGTAANTRLVADIAPGSGSSSPYMLAPLGNRVVFRAANPTFGSEAWVSDGTATGTTMLVDLEPGARSSFPGYFTAVGNRVVFGTSGRGVLRGQL